LLYSSTKILLVVQIPNATRHTEAPTIVIPISFRILKFRV
jgi:hypothetical protein